MTLNLMMTLGCGGVRTDRLVAAGVVAEMFGRIAKNILLKATPLSVY